MTWTGKTVIVTGGAGFLGRVLVARLLERGANVIVPRSACFDLRRQDVAEEFFRDTLATNRLHGNGIDVVFHLAAVVGGIGFNRDHPADCAYDNLAMGMNVMECSRKAGVGKFVMAGTVCSYPKFAAVPFQEHHLWDGYPEETNAPYGVAKKALLELGQAMRKQHGFNAVHLLLANLYGPGDNFKRESSHVIPALIRKMDEALEEKKPEVVLWGDGTPTREFLFVDDAADALLTAAESYDHPDPLNVGTEEEVSIAALAEKIRAVSGYPGKIVFDPKMPNGQPRRKLDTLKARECMGWTPKVSLDVGLAKTWAWWEDNDLWSK